MLKIIINTLKEKCHLSKLFSSKKLKKFQIVRDIVNRLLNTSIKPFYFLDSSNNSVKCLSQDAIFPLQKNR